MTNEEVFNALWDLFYTLDNNEDRKDFEEAVGVLVRLFPDEI